MVVGSGGGILDSTTLAPGTNLAKDILEVVDSVHTVSHGLLIDNFPRPPSIIE